MAIGSVQQTNPSFNFPADGSGDDTKYVAGLSTILVATIQEVKDRVSQIELLFCTQIFPTFQSTSKSLTRARESLAEEWRSKEAFLLKRIEQLEDEKERAEEDRRREADSLTAKFEAEKAVLAAKLEGLEKGEAVIQELREQIGIKSAEAAERKEMQERLMKEVDRKEEELGVERSKRRKLAEGWKEMNERYKKVKSQYVFLLSKSGLLLEEDVVDGEVEGLPVGSRSSKRRLKEIESKEEETTPLVEITPLGSQPDVQKSGCSSLEIMDNLKESKGRTNLMASSSSKSPSNSSSLHAKKACNAAFDQIHGKKQTTSYWKDTRANQVQRGADPHDDFLDTPMENIRGNIKKLSSHAEVQDVPVLAPNDMDFYNSDDETQDVNDQPIAANQKISILKPGSNGFKYVEPVRKKADRENLKGVECKQCRKFYDAVHAEGGGRDGGNGVRCEHHDGVSRHRYKYVPPMTPEGFWNIGFDSEM